MDSVMGKRGSIIVLNKRASAIESDSNISKPLISQEEWKANVTNSVVSATASNDDSCCADEKTKLLNDGKGKGGNDSSSSEKGSSGGLLAEIPAIIVTLMINFMTAIPFGVAYFPLGWSGKGDGCENSTSEDVCGPFPIQGKEVLGIRMFLMACITGQIALMLSSNFKSPVSVQLIENVPFYHAMAGIVITEQGYGKEALSTLFFIFGLSSIVTGLMFYGLGKAGLGKAVYYFPNHVLTGFIGGIGIFIAASSSGVMIGEDFTFDVSGVTTLVAHFGEYAPVVIFEVVLRILMAVLKDENGEPKFSLLAPIYFISIIPMYYAALYAFGISLDEATSAGYFFPGAATAASGNDDGSSSSSPSFLDMVFDGHVMDLFRIVDFTTISWTAVTKSLGTIVGVSCFSVVNVPINIPAFANACDVEVDMNNELMTHGYSNILSGIFGGIQNVMTYSISVLYYKSGGKSKAGLVSLILGTIFIFVFGTSTMPYIPRCMAGTLLLHIGVDLFLEGIAESYEEYDKIEYAGIVSIVLVMTFMGMTPALIAGVVVAMTTYAMQSVQNLDPIFKITSATTLRSSAWTRPSKALAVLDSPDNGRSKIMIVQLQGNLFFGNAVDLVDRIKEALSKDKPLIVIIDFTLVVNMDSSAAQAVNKLKNTMTQIFKVQTNIFVMGNKGYFPTEYGLSTAILEEGADEENVNVLKLIPKNQVCVGFDDALVFAEDILITREDPSLLIKESHLTHLHENKKGEDLDEREEKELAIHYLQNLLRPDFSSDGKRDATKFFSYFKREVYRKNDIVWKQGSKSDSAKLILCGELIASMEGSDVSEELPRGVVIGELGLIEGSARLSGVVCESNHAVVFSLNRDAWELLIKKDPTIARIMDDIAIRYLSHRVQHVSNRIYETRCLPV